VLDCCLARNLISLHLIPAESAFHKKKREKRVEEWPRAIGYTPGSLKRSKRMEF